MSEDGLSLDLQRAALRKALGAAEERYVAFVDVLGFSARLEHDYGQAAKDYEALFAMMAELRRAWFAGMPNEHKSLLPSVNLFSDAFLIVGRDLLATAFVARALQASALMTSARSLVRGGIAKGTHAEASVSVGDRLFASQPLARAVALEKIAHHPRIVLSEQLREEVEGSITALPQEKRSMSPFYECEDGIWAVKPIYVNERLGLYLEKYETALDELVSASEGKSHRAKCVWARSQLKKLAASLIEEVQQPKPP